LQLFYQIQQTISLWKRMNANDVCTLPAVQMLGPGPSMLPPPLPPAPRAGTCPTVDISLVTVVEVKYSQCLQNAAFRTETRKKLEEIRTLNKRLDKN
jgi:hypothetical protein